VNLIRDCPVCSMSGILQTMFASSVFHSSNSKFSFTYTYIIFTVHDTQQPYCLSLILHSQTAPARRAITFPALRPSLIAGHSTCHVFLQTRSGMSHLQVTRLTPVSHHSASTQQYRTRNLAWNQEKKDFICTFGFSSHRLYLCCLLHFRRRQT
jgi:hypothetical protein